MKKLILSVAVMALVSGCSDNGADADGDGKITAEEVAKEMNEVNLEPGEWENTVEFVDVKMDGLPKGMPEGMSKGMLDSMKGRTMTSKSCITEEQAKNPGAEFFAAQEKTNCEVKEFSMSGGAMKSEMSCKNIDAPGMMNMAMSGQYGPSSYEMEMKMDSEVQGMKMNISAKNSGKRIGDCPSS